LIQLIQVMLRTRHIFPKPMTHPIISEPERPVGRARGPRQTEERWAQYGIFLLVFYATARAVVSSVAKPFWFDEIVSWIIARQPNLAAIWAAFSRGAETQPPLFDLIERSAAVIPNAEVGFRLPSVIGFACVLVCLFVFVRRRSGGIYGLISAAMVMSTTLYMPYAIEARPYSLEVACVAVALIAYQRAPAFRWVALMAFALAMAESLHYYAIFAILSFAAAEGVFFWKTSTFRLRIWVSLILGALPLVAFWPLLAHLKVYYGQNFWAQPTLWSLRDVYGHFLQVSYFWGLAASVVCGLVVLGALSLVLDEPAEENAKWPFHERILVFFLLATPLIVFVATKLVHGGYTERYVLFSVLGISSAIGIALPRLGRPTLIVFSALLVSAIAVQEASFWLSKKPHWHVQSNAPLVERMLRTAGHADLPVVVTNRQQYLELVYYAPQPLSARLISVVDAPAALRYAKTDSDERFLPVLATVFPLRVYNLQTLRSAFPSFLLYSSEQSPDWWLDLFVHDGYGLRVLASEQGSLVFLVTPD